MAISDLQRPFGDIAAEPLYIAGPCSAESREQVLAAAEALANLGVPIFRAGVWKPRTKPGSFEGMGAEALVWLQEVKQSYGMKVVTEVATPEHVEMTLAAGLDGVYVAVRVPPQTPSPHSRLPMPSVVPMWRCSSKTP